MYGIKDDIVTEFSAIMDIDVAIMSLIKDKFNNPKIINQDVMHMDSYNLRCKLLNRKNENPLTICIQDKKIANDIYKQICEKEYDEVLERCRPNGVFKLMETYSEYNYKVYVICRSKRESDTLKKYSDNKFTIVLGDFKDIKDDQFGVIFIKTLTHMFLFQRKIKNKHIFISGYRYNMDYDNETKKLVPQITLSRYFIPENRIGYVDVYDNKMNIKLLNEK